MHRIRRPGGQLVLPVWDALESSPGYSALAISMERLFAMAVSRELHAPFRIGKQGVFIDLLQAMGITG